MNNKFVIKNRKFALLICTSLVTLSSCGVTSTPSIADSSSPSTSDSTSISNPEFTVESIDLFVGQVYNLEKIITNYEKNSTFAVNLDSDIAIIDENEFTITGLNEGESSLKLCNLEGNQIDSVSLKVIDRSQVESINYHDLGQRNDWVSLDSLGKQEVLVLPILIEGYEYGGSEANLTRLNEAFNGENAYWESVSSYYYKSSYGKLDLNFTIPNAWYDSGLTPGEIYAANDGYYGVTTLINNALTWYKENYESDLTKYDKDKDGFLDSVWAIYSAPNYNSSSYTYAGAYDFDPYMFWAFTASNMNSMNPDVNNPKLKMFSWASYDFMNRYGSTDAVDTHTYIHETGHLLGLDDYYAYSSAIYETAVPLGAIDMMDRNIGDHIPFSKFSLGWTSPKVVTESMTIKIKPFESSGDFVLLSSDSYNNSAFDEYFTIEYLTPTGLNELDYNNVYNGNNLQGYSKAGIRIVHVDARCINNTTDHDYSYASSIDEMVSVSQTNSGSTTLDSHAGANMYLTTLMQKNYSSEESNVLSDEEAYVTKIKADLDSVNDALFFEGDVFSLDEGSPYRELMPSKNNRLNKYYFSYSKVDTFNYSVEVVSLDEEYATLKIERRA